MVERGQHLGAVSYTHLDVYKRQDVADFREALDRLERDLPGAGQLPLLAGGDVVPFDRNADRRGGDKDKKKK